MQGDSPHRIRIAVLAVVGLLVVWQVVARGIPAYLARESPRAALEMRANEPTALANLADQELNLPAEEVEGGGAPDVAQQTFAGKGDAPSFAADRLGGWSEIALRALARQLGRGDTPGGPMLVKPRLTPQEREQIHMLAERALLNDPFNARALRILGQLAESAGDDAAAARFMQAAAARSLGESVAVYSMLQRSLNDKAYDRTVYYADAFLRKRPQLVAYAAPMLARMAESPDPAASAALTTALAADPPWRSLFLSNMLPAITDARTPLMLLLALKDTPTPPTTADLSAYLNFLIGHKLYELAYYTWLQFLPPEQLNNVGLLINGSFEATPSGLPFDWTMPQGAGVTIDIASRPEAAGDHALLLEFGPGRADFRGVSQLLMLSPGSYRFQGKLKGEIRGRRGMQWRIVCLGAQVAIGEGPMFIGVAPAWTDFNIAFTVPSADCRAQDLRLSLAARSASEQLVSGSIWYDELRVVRTDQPVESETLPPQP